MKKSVKKTLVSLLSLILIANSIDVSGLTVYASEIVSKSAVIMEFEELASDIYGQTIAAGSEESAITFPSTLTAMVKKTVTTKTVSGNNAVVSGSDASGGNSGAGIEEIIETQTTDVVETIEVLGWKIDAANSDADSFVSDDSAYGYVYTYVPQLKLTDTEGTTITIADGVELPEIYVRVGDPLGLLANPSFTVNYYVEVEAGSDSRAIAVTNPKNSTETKYFLHMEQLVVNYTEGKVVRGAYVVDNGAQLVNDVATGSGISSTKRNYDYAEIAHDYNNVTGTQTNGGEGTVTADGSLTFNFYWKTATYSEYHLVETENDGSTSGLISYNGKYYQILQSNEVKVTAANANTTVTIPDLSGTGEFESYTALTSQSTTYPTSGTVDSLGTLSLYRFYDKRATTSYTEKYYVEDENATENYITLLVGSELITYQLHHENTVENAYVGSKATITDLSGTSAFSGYTLVDRTGQGYYPERTVQEANLTNVYQFYDKNPTCNYSVVYYVEVYEEQRDGSNIVVKVNGEDKYYNRIPDSAYNMSCQAPEGTIITVADHSSDIPGVYAGGVKVSDTFKAYTSTLRKYSYDATVAYGKHTGTVAADGSLQIVLFYDWIETTSTTAKYTEKYYAELADQNVAYGYEEINGVKYELLGAYEKTGTIGSEAEIEDISIQEPYKTEYELMDATDTHPSKAHVAADNSTVLYQIYRLHPQYMITYYKEADNGTVTVGDKKYTIENYLIKRMPQGTTISYKELTNGAAAVAVGGTEIADTVKTYDGYEFSADATQQRGRGSVTVTRGDDNTIELFFDKIVPTTTYTEKYYVELDDQSTTTYDYAVGGVKYQLWESNVETIKNNLGATITDKSTQAPYTGWTLQPATATYPWEVDDVADDDSTVLYQFYHRDSQCKIQYYKETVAGTPGAIIGLDGKSYSDDGYLIIRMPVGTSITYQEQANGAAAVAADGAEIAGTSRVYDGYEFSPEATLREGWDSIQVTDGSANLIMLFYEYENPMVDYTVRYYKETSVNTAGAVQVGDKYYELAEAMEAECLDGTVVAYAERQDGMVGVTENSVEKADTFKSYANYVFHAATTLQNSKDSVTVTKAGENVIELFYNKALTASYTAEYYGEIEDQSSDVFDKKIAGVKYQLLDSYRVAGVAHDVKIEIADKSGEYTTLGYDLMPETQDYPSWSANVNSDGSTVLYQIYRLRPRYAVHYYTEVDNETTETIEICGKYYVKQESDSIVRYPAEGTVITYAEKSDREAGVAEDGGGVADTLRSYDGYLFSSVASRVNGKVLGTVTWDNRVVIELFFERIRADYTERYWVENPDATTDYIEVKAAGTVRKFVLAKTNLVEDAWIHSKVSAMDRSSDFADYSLVYEAVEGYSAVAYGINADGSTEVHQFFILKEEASTESPVADIPNTNPWQKSQKDEIAKRKSPATGDKANRGLAILALCVSYMAILLKRKMKE